MFAICCSTFLSTITSEIAGISDTWIVFASLYVFISELFDAEVSMVIVTSQVHIRNCFIVNSQFPTLGTIILSLDSLSESIIFTASTISSVYIVISTVSQIINQISGFTTISFSHFVSWGVYVKYILSDVQSMFHW